jgi:hypothetical protein
MNTFCRGENINRTINHTLKFTAGRQILKGEALLTVGYMSFGNKSYSYKMYS